eukprot:TRINITY_DN5229_c0_g1_i3.p1 TRINITY_DN5229_c0_g1~~TRINITY_DN5229_c0_g1_i3.p1  ORF type:complete len:398 (-),score=38.57 TRINITY_DN5229_c0_g1_i3:87-1280(-)
MTKEVNKTVSSSVNKSSPNKFLLQFSQSQPSISKTISSPPPKMYNCQSCGKIFDSQYKVTRHQLVHSGEKKFSCQICNKSFSEQYRLKRHVLTHTGEKSFPCDICGKLYSRKDHLNRHIAELHLSEEQYSCDICAVTFPNKRSLSMHKRIHGDSSKFKDLHNVRTETLTELNSVKKQENLSDVKEIIPQEVRLSSSLTITPIPKRITCEICNESFDDNAKLKLHVRKSHSGEKVFSCEVCNKNFLRKDHLEVHSRIHTGARPYSCNLCEKAFYRADKLRSHMKTHANESTDPMMMVHPAGIGQSIFALATKQQELQHKLLATSKSSKGASKAKIPSKTKAAVEKPKEGMNDDGTAFIVNNDSCDKSSNFDGDLYDYIDELCEQEIKELDDGEEVIVT